MKGRTACLSTAAVLALPLLATTPAHAAVTRASSVTSPACGTINATLSEPYQAWLRLDDQATELSVTAGRATQTWRGLPAGRYAWETTSDQGEVLASGWVSVTACSSGSAHRRPEGDLTGDGRADLLAVSTAGQLYAYRSTGSALASLGQVGSGWASFVFLQRLTHVGGQGGPDRLVGIRSDGTLWMYPLGVGGRVGRGWQAASGLGAHDGWVVTHRNTDLGWGSHTLWGLRDGRLVRLGSFTVDGFLADTAGQSIALPPGTSRVLSLPATTRAGTASLVLFDTAGDVRRCGLFTRNTASPDDDLVCQVDTVGHGWQAMQLVRSPGSVDGDLYSDLVARRSDGDLYVYRVVDGVIRPGTVIGHNWNGIKLLA